MHHLHFKKIDSTQLYLKENILSLLEVTPFILISAEEQSNGIGRSGNSWVHNPGSIAFSFTIAPNKILTVTPIEIGLIIVKFFHEKYKIVIKLKWPNDLMDSNNFKVGGLISNFQNPNVLIIGVGINLGNLLIDDSAFRYKASALDAGIRINEDLYKELYAYIIQNRISESTVLNLFELSCSHLNKQVRIEESGKIFEGIFIGCDENGAAKIKINNEIKYFISGSLTII